MRPPRKKVNFRHGDKVEVCSNEEGFIGSYYLATVVSRLDNGLYVVRYDTLLEDDGSQPLTETLFPNELRPKPPPLAALHTRDLQLLLEVGAHLAHREQQAEEADDIRQRRYRVGQAMNFGRSASGRPSSSEITASGRMRA